MIAFDHSFFLTGGMNAELGYYTIFVCLLGNQEEAKNFEARISFGDKDDQLVHNANVYPMSLGPDTIVNEKFPFSCRMQSILSLVDSRNMLNVVIKLVNKKIAEACDPTCPGITDVD